MCPVPCDAERLCRQRFPEAGLKETRHEVCFLSGGHYFFLHLFLKTGLQFEYSLNKLWLIAHTAFIKKPLFDFVGIPATLSLQKFSFTGVTLFFLLIKSLTVGLSKERDFCVMAHTAFFTMSQLFFASVPQLS